MEKNVPAALKLSNRKIVYRVLAGEDGLSRADIARRTGISGATVIKIAEYLAGRNIISYDPSEPTALPGRKPTPLRFNKNFAYCIAIYMEGIYTSIGILNASGDAVLSQDFKVPDTERFFQKELYAQVDKLMKAGGIDRNKLIGIGIAIPAAVDPVSKRVFRAPLFHDTKLANLESILQEISARYSLPVFVENDVNAAAYGEYRRVYADVTSALVYISLGSGLGGGIILNNKLWKGQKAGAGEIGYMLFDPHVQQTSEQLGWLETKINVTALRTAFHSDIQTPIDQEQGSKIAHYLSKYISLAILNIYATLDIQTVVLGGVLTEYLSAYLLPEINRELRRMSAYAPEVVYGKIKKPGFVGLSCIIIDELLDQILT
ncbi:MAG: ROK family protein [Treponema sp.]|jgi:predicted NBD/HSP70 family sugar kinase|nr:ROK family protein [Treponema sp.]